MELLTAKGKEFPFNFGMEESDVAPEIKVINLGIIEILWNEKTRDSIIAIGIPYVYAIGILH